MATFSDISRTAHDEDFRRRVSYALTVAALAAYNEGTGVTGHALRAAYATKVLASQFDLQGAVLGVLTNSTIAAESNSAVTGNGVPDSDIQFAVNSIYNALAGA